MSTESTPRGSDDVDWTSVGRRLAAARRALGLTQKQVAERVEVRPRAVWSWEHGEFAPTTRLPKLAELYGVSTQFLLYGVEESSREMMALRHEIAHLQMNLDDVKEAVADLATSVAGGFDGLTEIVKSLAAEQDSVAD
jgi:transcriptional regulator with XRE-family HTH domain